MSGLLLLLSQGNNYPHSKKLTFYDSNNSYLKGYMNLLIDNSTIRAAGRCLDGKAQGSQDVLDLLQLLTAYVFSQRVFIPGFVHDKIKIETIGVINKLEKQIGFDKNFFVLTEENQESIRGVCHTASTSFYDAFKSFESRITNDSLPLFGFQEKKTGIPESEKNHTRDIHSLLNSSNGPDLIENIKKDPFSNENREYGTVGYMIASSEFIQKFVDSNKDDWSPRVTFWFIAVLRFYLNVSISKKYFADYLPSITRAKMIRSDTSKVRKAISEYLLDGVNNIIDKKTITQLQQPGKIPAISRALAYRSGGKVKPLLEYALDARIKGQEFRDLLSKRFEKYKADEFNLMDALDNDLKGLARALRYKINPQKLIEESLEIDDLAGIPIPNLSSLPKWGEMTFKRKQLTILSEFAKTLDSPLVDDDVFKQLEYECSHI